MQVWKQWALRFSVAAITVLGLCALALAWWLPSGEELAQRLTAEANDKLGIKISIGAVHWELLPTPAITIHTLRTQQTQPVVIGTITAYPNLRMLLQRKLVLKRMVLEDATIPRNSVQALLSKTASLQGPAHAEVPLERLVGRSQHHAVHCADPDHGP